jgi:hypothetical protein
MPVRDYYLNEGATFDAYRAAYKTYVTKMFELIGDSSPAASANAVVALETELATVHWSPERRRDVQATNNPVDRAGLAAMIRAVDWDVFLPVAGLGAVQNFVVNETTALRDGAALLDTQPVDAWKKYLAFHLASTYASNLPKAFDDADFDFYRRTLAGVEVQRDRWKRGVELIDGLIGEGVGEVYVARFFPPDYKAKMDELVANLVAAMSQRLKRLAWMDDATRAEADKKLATFEPRVGYPVKWRDYSAYAVERGKLFENVRNGTRFDWNRQVARLDEPVDRDEWGMNPQTVNAYYNPLVNQITFPAAILQPPFFDPYADTAVNYGAIGAVIGHEMGHGYDDQGREYDETGRIRNWWTPETNDKFMGAIGKFAEQYNAFCPLEAACVNGNFTMGENIGDLGGLEMAYTAYKLSLGGREAPVIDGFTGDQRFFMAHAQVWRAHPARRRAARADALRSALAGRCARLDPRAQHGCVVRRFRRQARRRAVHRAREPRENLVEAEQRNVCYPLVLDALRRRLSLRLRRRGGASQPRSLRHDAGSRHRRHGHGARMEESARLDDRRDQERRRHDGAPRHRSHVRVRGSSIGPAAGGDRGRLARHRERPPRPRRTDGEGRRTRRAHQRRNRVAAEHGRRPHLGADVGRRGAKHCRPLGAVAAGIRGDVPGNA